MPFLGRLSDSDSQQNPALSRRELLGKSLVIGAALLLSKSQSKESQSKESQSKESQSKESQSKESQSKESQSKESQSKSSSSYPLPEFKIGDLVASDWEPDEEDDDAPDSATDFGEVLGMRWMPEAEGNWTPAHTWVYYVYWTHGTCGSDICYPCYDGEPTRACDLRLVKQS